MALAQIDVHLGTGLGQVHLGRDVPIYDGRTAAALRDCGLAPSHYATHAMVPPDTPVPLGFPVHLAEAHGWRLVATGQPTRPPPWLALSPVALGVDFPGRVARQVFEPDSDGLSWPLRLWAFWRGDMDGAARPLAPLLAGRPGSTLRVALPDDCQRQS